MGSVSCLKMTTHNNYLLLNCITICSVSNIKQQMYPSIMTWAGLGNSGQCDQSYQSFNVTNSLTAVCQKCLQYWSTR